MNSHSMSRTAATVALLCAACTVHAQLYKCAGSDGQVSYQQQPCDSGSTQSQVSPASSGSGVRLAPNQSQGTGDSDPMRRRKRERPEAAAKAIEPSAAARSTGAAPMAPPNCAFPWTQVPGDTEVLAVTSNGAAKALDFPIDASGGYPVTQVLQVNRPGRKVALLLGFTVPTVWQVRWTDRTEIVAVWASGSGRQAVIGLPRSVPVFVTRDSGDRSACGSFVFHRGNFRQANEMALRAFGLSVTKAYTLSLEETTIGEPFPIGIPVHVARDITLKDVEDPKGWRVGEPAIDGLIRSGHLRPALRREQLQWEALAKAKLDVPPVANPPPSFGSPNDVLGLVLVVQKPFAFPPGLLGGHSRYFIVPAGSAVPTGDPGHSTIYDMNDASCCGVCPDWLPRRSITCPAR